MPPAALEALAARATRRRYRPGAAIFLEGDPGDRALIIQEGDVKLVTTSHDGRELVLDVVGPSTILGELAAIDGGPRSATAIAMSAVEVCIIAGDVLKEVGRQHPVLFEVLLVEVAARLRTSDQRQLEFGGDALGRVCARLIQIADRQGTSTGLELPVSQSELAAWTGLSREAVVKGFATLRRLGWVRTEGRRVTLLEAGEVRRRATS